MKTHNEMIAAWKDQPEYRSEYDALEEEEFRFYEEIIKARMNAGLSQEDVARGMNTTKSAVSRLERGGGRQQHSPSLSTLRKYAKAVECQLEITLHPLKS